MSIEMDVEVPENQENVQKPSYSHTIIDSFRKLTNCKENVFNKNAVKLLEHVQKSSKNDNKVEVQYVLNRLIRGLGSSARVGYYPILVALLDTVPEILFENVVKSIENELQVAGGSSKSEKTDAYHGQLLCGGAVLRSKLFLKLSKEHQKYVLELILNTRNDKRSLSCVASSFITDFVNSVDKEQFFATLWPVFRSSIKKTWEEQTIDDVYLAMVIQSKFPETIKTPQMITCFGQLGILTKSNVDSICNVLFKLADVKALQHPAYETIGKIIAQSKMLPPFLTSLDAQLLKLNRNKLLIASVILRNILPNVPNSEKIPDLLTNNFVSKLVEYHKTNKQWKGDKEFNAELKNVFKTLIDSLAKEEVSSQVKIRVIKRLIFYPGSLTFDNTTETRVLQNIIPTLDLQGVKSLSLLFKDIALGVSQASEDGNTKRQWSIAEKKYALEVLAKLLCHSKVKDDVKFRAEYTKIFMDLGFLENKESVLISNWARDLFFKALENKFSKLVDLHGFLAQLNKNLKVLITLKNLNVSFSEEEVGELKKMFQLTDNQKFNDTAGQVFHILFYYMGLQCLKNKELAFSCINELFLCYERVGGKRVKKRDDPEWIEVIVDLFLSLLSQESLLRSFIASIFPSLCEYLTPLAIEQILNVMDPASGDNPLSNADDDEEEDEEADVSDNEDNESDPDADEVDSEEKDDSEDESDEDESDEDNSEFEDSATDLDKLRLAVQQALQSDNNDKDDTDSVDLDLDCMSETEGDRLDKALENAFKQFRSGKLEKKTERDRILMNLRLRVIDLIEIIINNEPSMSTCLKIMKALSNTLEFTTLKEDQAPLQTRISSVLKKLKSVKKFSNTEEVTLEELGSLFKDITDKGESSILTYKHLTATKAVCCGFIIKCSQILCKSDDISSPTEVTDNAVIQAMHSLIKQSLEKRFSTISFSILLKTFDSPWIGNLFMVQLLLSNFHEVKAVKQRLILNVLVKFYLNRRIQYSEEEFKSHLKSTEIKFVKKFKKSVDQFCTDPSEESNPVAHDIAVNLLKLFKLMVLHPFKNTSIKWESLAESLKTYACHVSIHMKSLCNNLCRVLNVPVSTDEVKKIQSKKAKKPKLQVTPKEDVGDSENEVDETEEVVDTSSKKNKRKRSKKQKIKAEGSNDVAMKNANTSITKSENNKSKKQKMKMETSLNLSSNQKKVEDKNVVNANVNNKKRRKKTQNKNFNLKKPKLQ